MNKKELVKLYAEKLGVSQKAASTYIDAFVDVLTDAMVKGNDVRLTGFGSFSVAERSERTGHNPATMEPITIAACKVPKFKASKTLKDAINV